MTSGPMRKLPAPSTSLRRAPCRSTHTSTFRPSTTPTPHQVGHQKRRLAQVRPEPLNELWFTSSVPRRSPADDLLNSPGPGQGNDHKPRDERRLKLGKTLRTLSPLLPNILTTALPQDILSPSVSLHLFPSTHPHLPTVRGPLPYRAALWTAPVAWGCVPLVGNVKLQIVSEKIVRSGFHLSTPRPQDQPDLGEEKLVVRWRTEKKKNGAATESAARSTTVEGNGGINRGLSTLLGGDKPIFNLNKSDEFTGIFVFTFDGKGRIATHTIEHADENNGFDKTSRVVTLTDWLLGKAKWGVRPKEEELVPGLAMRVCREEWARQQGRGRTGKERLW